MLLSPDSSVAIATGWTAGVRFPAETRFFSSTALMYGPRFFCVLLSCAYRGLANVGFPVHGILLVVYNITGKSKAIPVTGREGP
jgi:hypothetical protein